MRVRMGATLLAAVVLVGLGLALAANRTIPPTGAVSYVGRDGPVPSDWTWDAGMTGGLPRGSVVVDGTWSVRAEPGVPESTVMTCQEAGGPTGLMPLDFLLVDKRFPLLALDASVWADFVVEAPFKLLGGNVDRAAGIAFRIQDQGNYYVVRANALEGNVNLYKFDAGRRSIIHEARANVPSGLWQTLGVKAERESIGWSLDGRPLGQVEDTTYESGGLGLWTKADSITCFAGLRVRAL
jgi:hypothetical protein